MRRFVCAQQMRGSKPRQLYQDDRYGYTQGRQSRTFHDPSTIHEYQNLDYLSFRAFFASSRIHAREHCYYSVLIFHVCTSSFVTRIVSIPKSSYVAQASSVEAASWSCLSIRDSPGAATNPVSYLSTHNAQLTETYRSVAAAPRPISVLAHQGGS